MILEGRTVLVVGVGPGLGASCARLALRDGANVAVMARNAQRLHAFAAEIDPTGERVIACAGDIGSKQDCTAAAPLNAVAATASRVCAFDAEQSRLSRLKVWLVDRMVE